MIIARVMKIVPRAAGELDNTSSTVTLFTRVAYIFSTIEQKKTVYSTRSVLIRALTKIALLLASHNCSNEKKNNDKQQFSPVVKNAMNTYFLHDCRKINRIIQKELSSYCQ
jgi:hypothetical protein